MSFWDEEGAAAMGSIEAAPGAVREGSRQLSPHPNPQLPGGIEAAATAAAAKAYSCTNSVFWASSFNINML